MSHALLPYQQEGVAFLRSRRHALLADDPGLGKTAQVLKALDPSDPVLVVCPRVAKGVWRSELNKWRPGVFRVYVPPTKAKFRLPQPGEVVIVTYDSVPLLSEIDGTNRGTILVADEAHMVKTGSNKRCNAFRSVCVSVTEQQGKIWMLTGTPMPNSPDELWRILSYTTMAKTAYGDAKRFLRIFNGKQVQGAYGLKLVWGRPTKEAREGFNKVALRRRRDDVLPELPKKFYKTVECSLSTDVTKMCDTLAEAMYRLGLDWEQLVDMAWGSKDYFGDLHLSEVRNALAVSKIPTLIEVVEEAEQQKTPTVVFSAHRAPVEALRGREGWDVITGETSAAQRSAIVEQFQQGKLFGVAATIKAAGVALTLTRSHNCVFVDRDWTPANNLQAEGRLQRIGQKSNILVTNLVCDHALDIHVTETLMRKQAIIEEVME